MPLDRLCHTIRYRFSDPRLLRQALTHRSVGVPNNERLEFLGDSILNCIIAQDLYRRYPKLSEGELSRLRAYLVKEQRLAEVAVKLDLGDYLILGEGEMKSGGYRRPSILADTVEALIGAVFLDGGFTRAVEVIATLYHGMLENLDAKAVGKDPKTLLQEYVQSRKCALPQYTVVTTSGEAHRQNFEVECAIPELNIRSHGSGSSRRGAEQDAAKAAYRQATHA
ncbi:MAG TPA: ribonuclease III [Betaproteobacteria bacterium]|nr:ribonuclease III [Betaproteobacteria bacterium]